MFTLVVTAPVPIVNELFVHVWKISYVSLNGVSYLYADFILIMNWSPTLKPKSIIVEFLWITSFSICSCLLWRFYLQFAMLFIGRIMYQTNTNWTRLFPLVRWYVDHTAKAASARIPIRVSASSTYISCSLYVSTRFPDTWCILYMVVFDYVFPEEYGLVLIPYSFSIQIFLNLWPRNSPPCSYMISIGREYQTSHIVFTKFANQYFFLVYVLRYIRPPVYGVYHCNGFKC